MSAWEHVGKLAVFLVTSAVFAVALSVVEHLIGSEMASRVFRTVLTTLALMWTSVRLWGWR